MLTVTPEILFVVLLFNDNTVFVQIKDYLHALVQLECWCGKGGPVVRGCLLCNILIIT